MSNRVIGIFGVLLVLACGLCFGDIVVDHAGSGDYLTIQAGINAAAAGDVVVVMPGTYLENIDMKGKAIMLQSTDPMDQDIVLATIIDGNSSGSVITCHGGEGFDTVISGFVITNGSGDGGGMDNRSSSPSVANCAFVMNKAYGGGMYNWNSSPAVTNCTFSGNESTQGGAIYNGNSSPTLTNCMFSGNTASKKGGAIYNSSSLPTVTSSYFCSNTPDTIYGSYTDGGGNNLLYCPPPRPIEAELFGDSDGDGDVDLADLAAFAANWLVGTEQ